MRLLKRLLLGLVLSINFGFVAVPATAYGIDVLKPVCDKAQNDTPAVCDDNAANSSDNPLIGPNGIITKAVSILSTVIGIVSIFVIILFGGLRYITSAGNPQTISAARQAVIFAVIGLMVAVAARTIVALVLSKVPN